MSPFNPIFSAIFLLSALVSDPLSNKIFTNISFSFSGFLNVTGMIGKESRHLYSEDALFIVNSQNLRRVIGFGMIVLSSNISSYSNSAGGFGVVIFG